MRQFVERFAGAMADAGMPRMPALVFVTLLAEDEPRLTADDLVERLQISRAAVSGAVQYLVQVGLVRREREAGSRRDHYALEDENWFAMLTRREKILEVWTATARTGVDALDPATPAGARLERSAEFFEFMQHELVGILERWRTRPSR